MRFSPIFGRLIQSINLVKKIYFSLAVLCFIGLSSCEKDPILVPDNNAPGYEGVPTLQVENYVNRLYIDLLGREPLDSELARDVGTLRAGNLSTETREGLIRYIQTDETFIEGDTSYLRAYHQNLYDLAKVRCLEGVSDAFVLGEAALFDQPILIDSINGNWEGYADKTAKRQLLLDIVESREKLQNGEIELNEMFASMIYNAIYDEINMNSFNFVNATFDNLLWRFPTQAEFEVGYDMIEYNTPGALFGVTGQDKAGYVAIFENANETLEGLIIWSYKRLMARDPSSAETTLHMQDLIVDKDLDVVIRNILITDEYAGFE